MRFLYITLFFLIALLLFNFFDSKKCIEPKDPNTNSVIMNSVNQIAIKSYENCVRSSQ